MLSSMILFLFLATNSHAAYVIDTTYEGSNFLDGFNFQTPAGFDAKDHGDPTHGFVNYVSREKAEAEGLAKLIGDQVYLGVDTTKTLSTSAQGRDSLRLESINTFNQGLLIADIAHMPGNVCGIWPALWTYNLDDPPIGEIDIVEGVNHQQFNDISLHSCDTCSFKPGNQTGHQRQNDCALGGDCADKTKNDDGCGMTATTDSSFGDGFNAAEGGVYAMELKPTSIRIWHFPRAQIPQDILDGTPNPNGWTRPMGDFQKTNGNCNIEKIFVKQNIIVNTDFCGDNITPKIWNADPKCKALAPTCKDYVAKHPEAFTEAYWLFNSIKLYKQF